jgi:tRNA threonylcarbamoyladenosine biosynthesis protein TsaB
MIILAIDTSSETVSIALIEDQTIRAEFFLNTGLNHSRILLPTIQHIYNMAALTIDTTDLFACTVGPGSFTGLRIGVGTIKGMALATNKPIIGVSTLEALASNVQGVSANICPIIDARRGQVYAAIYKIGANSILQMVGEERLTDIHLFLRELDGETFFIGSGALKYADSIKKILPTSVLASIEHSHIRASVVGLLGLKKFQEGKISDLLSLAPHYLHLSEAERNFVAAELQKAKC